MGVLHSSLLFYKQQRYQVHKLRVLRLSLRVCVRVCVCRIVRIVRFNCNAVQYMLI
jgi:hypothetical protein